VRAVAAIIATLLVSAVIALAGPARAAPAGDQEVVAFLVRGVGNGHGRGMSQWGAYGRAVDGQTWQQILDAYYGGTTSATRAEPHLRVRLTGWDGTPTLGVVSVSGRARWNGSTTDYTSLYATETMSNVFTVYGEPTHRACPGAATLTVPTINLQNGSTGLSVTELQQLLAAVGLSPGPIDGIFGSMTEAAVRAFEADEGLKVDGAWRQVDWQAAQARLAAGGSVSWRVLQTGVRGPIRFTTTINPSSGAPGDMLGVCQPSGQLTHYRGGVDLVDDGAGNRVVNDVDIDDYLRGVVPKEVIASWGNAAGGLGMNALRAQAVAARSYALSQNRYSYAKTCDTTSCQVYGGAATRQSATSDIVLNVEYATTDQAITGTDGVVRVKDGSVVSTEFSASNGPRTAGGSFPPVDDPWDDVPNNPNHTWTRVIDADTIRSRYGLASANGVATFHDAASNYDGVWANGVRLGNGASVSAWDFRNAFALPSPGFELVPIFRSVSIGGSFSFIGDSVGASVAGTSTAELRVLVEGEFTSATYDSLVSRRTQGGVIDDGVGAASRVPVGTGLVLVELGYNDDPAAMAGRIDAVMTELQSRHVGTVAWVTLSERRSHFAATNDAIMAAQNRWGNLVVLDWQAESRTQAAARWFADDVHLTATGRAEFGAFLRTHLVDLGSTGYTVSRRLVPGRPLHVPVLGRGGVPETGVAGVALNVTAVRTAAAGYLRVWSCDEDEPETSSVNFQAAGAVEPNAVVVPVGASGEVCVSTLVATDVIVDVMAWFESGLRSAPGRLVDTREGSLLGAGSVLRVPVLGRGGVPETGVAGVALNVTAVRTAAAGYLRVWSCDEDEPETSSVNFQAPGAVESNAVVVPVGVSGEVCVSSLVDTGVVVDVSGWFESGPRSVSGRLVDTRSGTRLAAGDVMRVTVTDRLGVPASGAAGVALNVTAVRTSASGHLQVWPCGSPKPDTSSVNFQGAGAVEPNAVIVPVDSTGEVCVSSIVDTDVVVDMTAWFDGAVRGLPGERLVDTRFGVGPIPTR
jgi:Stage II sporulation protein/Putative peptidoglycan binding domain